MKYWRVTDDEYFCDSEIFLQELDAVSFVESQTYGSGKIKIKEVTEEQLTDDELLDAHGLVELDSSREADLQLALRLIRLLPGM